MVTRRSAAMLMGLVRNLSYVYERSRSTWQIGPPQYVNVKGSTFILSGLQYDLSVVDSLVPHIKSLQPVQDSMRYWVTYLDKKYVEPSKSYLGPSVLDFKDAEGLATDCIKWLDTIIDSYGNDPGTILIKEENIQQIFPDSLTAKLDGTSREDLVDGYVAILHLLPTPATMILLRVAENMVRKYYVKMTGKSADNSKWADILEDLEKDTRVRKSLIGYLDYLRDIRNEAQHPDKRFNQEESERILLHVKGLLEEMDL